MVNADKGGVGDDVETLLAAIIWMGPPPYIRHQAGRVALAPLVGGLVDAG